MEGIKKINTARSPRTPKANNSPTFEQLLQGESSDWTPRSSSTLAKEHDHEHHFGHQNKKSVLAKVKERAIKIKHSLSKKKHGQEDTGSPSSCVALEDEENDDTSPEFLGAPMYESEQAPEACKETIRQQPREVQVVSEKHILTNNTVGENKNPMENKLDNKHKNQYQNQNQKADIIESGYKNQDAQISRSHGIITETKSQTSQNYGTISETKSDDISDNYRMRNIDKGGEQTWDKGVSVKEYLMHKFEPGENEKALSQVITEAISPRKNTRREMGVVDIVKEAVSSLLRNDETTTTQPITRLYNKETATQPIVNSSSPPIPISTNPDQVTEEENHGRILQAN